MKGIDYIRPYHDHEVHQVLNDFKNHPFMKALMNFTFSDKSNEEMTKMLDDCHSIYDLQHNILSHTIKHLLEASSEGVTTSGFDLLEADKPYLYLSNHRDIILDTSILNLVLNDKKMVMTASAIGDNLVQKTSLMTLAKLNRNFIIQRNLSPRDTLESSKMVSKYIRQLLDNGRSVWLAQREGRTKDGNDELRQGILKMLIMNCQNESISDYLQQLRIVPMTVSYEFDPTDMLKMPELIAKHYNEEYIKEKNEDFNTILKGVLGYKGRIHIDVQSPIDKDIHRIVKKEGSVNDQLNKIKEFLNCTTHKNYKLWPSNYVAYDMLYGDTYTTHYTEKEKRQFERRVERRVESSSDEVARDNFLNMYANPVVNAYKY